MPGPTTATPTPTKYGQSAKPRPGRAFTITLDPDLLLACEDIAGSMNLSLERYLQVAVNDALKTCMGL